MLRIAMAIALPAIAAGCSHLPDVGAMKLPRVDTNAFALQNPNLYNRQRAFFQPVKPEDLVDAEGRCAAQAPTGIDASLEPDLAAQPPPAFQRGVGLQMTECEVARALGQAQNVEISPGVGDARVVTMTYMSGERAGIYRFTGGRLAAIERGAEPPPPPRPEKKKPAPARTSTRPANS
jgi:hypothetical protein